MRFDKLDLNLLVALDALLAERNITRAAEKLHLSQSAMSNALGRLRDYFGDPLLVQVQRHMELTPRALSLKEPIRDVLVRIRATVATEPAFDPVRSDRNFNIFASDYTLHTVIPRMLAIAAGEGSRVHFRFQPLVGSPASALESGDADLLVIPQMFVSPVHPNELLLKEEFVCVVWAGSDHARRGLTREEYLLAEHVVMQPPVQSGARAYEDRAVDRAGLSRRIAVSTYAFASMPQMVVGTPYVATVHRRLAQAAVAQHPLVVLPPPIDIPPMRVMMQWHEFRSTDPGLVWLRALMRRAVESA